MPAAQPVPDLDAVLPDARVLLVVPPFVSLDMPSLAAHLLQAHARAAGIEVGMFYANVQVAAQLGVDAYHRLCHDLHDVPLVGERIFAPQAFGVDAPLRRPGDGERAHQRRTSSWGDRRSDKGEELEACRQVVRDWPDRLARAIAGRDFAIVGCTSSFEQTTASVALLKAVRLRSPGVTTILGGANCEGEMAEGLSKLDTGIDHIFSGESDETFVPFVQSVLDGENDAPAIIRGATQTELDHHPLPDHSEFFEQLSFFQIDPEVVAEAWVPYESSRGCWWGEKHHCTFCGLNGEGIVSRRKAPEVVLRDLERISGCYPTNRVFMVDNIMPRPYLKSLLPDLIDRDFGLSLFYEQKANLSFEDVQTLISAGVHQIQPGIEAVSTPLLRLMKKGVRAEQNVALLRYARELSLGVSWSLLYGFPGDRAEWYEASLGLLPLLRHLHPPRGVFQLSLDRFSPYFVAPDLHGISSVRPVSAYAEVFPEGADLHRIAYHFAGEYASDSLDRPDLIDGLREEVGRWREAWPSAAPDERPELTIRPMTSRSWLLRDTRGLPDTEETRILDREEARIAVRGGGEPGDRAVREVLRWGAAVEIDGRVAPLTTASPEVFADLAAARRTAREAKI